MWNRRASERRFSPSDWNGTPTEEVTSYDSSRTNGYNDSQTTLQSGSGAGEMNIDSIYDAIKTKDLTEDNNSGCSEGNLMMDSMRVHVDHHHKSSYVGAYPGHAVKIFTQRRASDPSLTDALTFSYPDSLDAPLSANANIWTRLLRGNDELWDKGDVYNDDDDDSETISEAKCSRLKTCAQLWFYDLLYKIMPRRAIQKIQRGQTVLEKFNLVTVFFSDIVGFTSMAGKMRPLQVMKMLNDLYTEFDKLVVKHGVYKVETIGDSFMVVSGAPDRVPAPLAAERVALFAIDAVNFVKSFRTKDGDQIFIRAGIASGKTVAGVVGNAMPRYCFFGDTINLASRMESTSVKMKIQVAELTHRLLQDSPNMLFDLERRKEGECFGIEVKGKGHQTTYWVKKAYKRVTLNKPIDAGTVDNYDIEEPRPNSLLPQNRVNQVDIPHERHDENSFATIEVTDELLCNPREIYRALTAEDWAVIGRSESPSIKATEEHEVMIARFVAILQHHLQLVLEERKPGSGISCSVQLQLAKYVNAIADTYDDPKFHQLSHAMHVTTSMNKLLYFSTRNGEVNSALENFSLIFAAFLHDAGHTGMTNKMLEDSQHPLSKKYAKDVPIAERFAIEIACDVLIRPEYEALRTAIMPDDKSKLKFAKALFQSILVTDIASPSRVKLCVQRYDISHNHGVSTPDMCPLAPHLPDIIALVFNGRKDIKESYPDEFRITPSGLQECVRREHFMLISDVAHLLQCWENFVKWNFRLYKEIHENYTKGLCPDPSVGWYEGQIGFLEKYAIPLAIRSQIFFTKEFSQSLVDLGQANLICWKDHGIVASSIMVTGVKENENLVLKRLYSLQSIHL